MTAIQTHRRALMHIAEETTVQLIPIEDIRMLNPQARNRQVFARLVENISALGLKRPISVAPTTSGTESYEIVCGHLTVQPQRRFIMIARVCATVAGIAEISLLITDTHRRGVSHRGQSTASKFAITNTINLKHASYANAA
jgi:hypothetical protein